MKLGKVKISHEYVVDLEKPDQIDDAKEALYTDLMNAVKFDEVYSLINVEEAPEATESDIPDFLKVIECPRCKENLGIDDFDDPDDICRECEGVEEELNQDDHPDDYVNKNKEKKNDKA